MELLRVCSNSLLSLASLLACVCGTILRAPVYFVAKYIGARKSFARSFHVNLCHRDKRIETPCALCLLFL